MERKTQITFMQLAEVPNCNSYAQMQQRDHTIHPKSLSLWLTNLHHLIKRFLPLRKLCFRTQTPEY